MPPPAVLYLSAEVAPLAASGGLGDVARALPRALAMLGHPVAVMAPLYRAVRSRGIALNPAAEINVPGHPHGRIRVFQAPGVLDPARLFFIEHDQFFDRPGLYGEGGGEYGDNLERFSFFCKAGLEATLALDLPVDVIHANDWHTGLVPAYLRTLYAGQMKLRSAATVFTIHNLAYQGRFPGERLPATGLPWSLLSPEGLEYYGLINCLKAGLVFSRVVTTVSPRYAAEIATPEYGEGLDGVVRRRGADVVGVLNGIDDDLWDPARDSHLPARYSAKDLSGKRRCKEALLAELGLSVPVGMPLVGMVTRLSWQKGCDIVLGVADEILGNGVALVLLGSGDPGFEHGFRELARRRSDRVAVRIGFDEALAHRIEAGADLFLMPSRYEPSGLNQMYSLRYGTVPLVRSTGGLADTVCDPEEDAARANGFKFIDPRGDQLVWTLGRALAIFRDRARWEELMRRGMAQDFSWRKSAMRTSELYRRL